jgi:hypothetical protein
MCGTLGRARWDRTFPCDALIFDGRETCLARKPKCEECVLEEVCPKGGSLEAKSQTSAARCRRGRLKARRSLA